MVQQTINLSMVPGAVNPVIHVSQYDSDEDALVFNLYAGAAFELPVGSAAVINGTKPDGYGFTYNATSQSGNTVTFDVTQQMTAVAGEVRCELRVSDGDNVVGTQNFTLMVEQAALDQNTVISDSDIPAIAAAADYAVEAAGYAADAADSAAEAASTLASKVSKAGDTMTGDLIVDSKSCIIKTTDPSVNTTPGSNFWGSMAYWLRDAANSSFGAFRAFHQTDGTRGVFIQSEPGVQNYIRLGAKSTTPVVTLSHPAAWRDALTVLPYNNSISITSVNCAGYTTALSTQFIFTIPYAAFSGTSISISKLGIVVRCADLENSTGIYPYIRSGTNGGTYTQLNSSSTLLYSGGSAVRSNEIDTMTTTITPGVGISIAITFKYAIAKASGNTTAITNNLPISIIATLDATVS